MIQVPPEGPTSAKIAFIGEAPGANEEKELRPFVGQSGVLFNNVLSAVNIHRPACRLTNVVKERPPNNNIKVFIDLDKKVPVLTDAYRSYEDALYDELSRLDANVLVPLGNVPLYALTRNRGILGWRGSILSTEIAGKARKVIPTIHPAALLPGRGKYVWKYAVMRDLTRIKEESLFPEIVLPERELLIAETKEEALAYIAKCREGKQVGFDIEVSIKSHEMFSIAFSPNDKESMSIPIFGPEERVKYFSPKDEAEIWDAVAGLLADRSVVKIAQNAIFDSWMLKWKFGMEVTPVRDTMIAHAILYPDIQKDLGYLTSIYTREPFFKYIGKEIFKEEAA